jgi:Tol biopolymer transport system component
MKTYYIVLCLLALQAGCRSQYLKFDDAPPGMTPEVFADDLLAPNGEHVGYCAFSPDGSELYYAITDKNWATSKIIRITATDLHKKDTMHFKDKRYEGEPFITRDGTTMFFMAVLPPGEGEKWNANQYRMYRNGKEWGAPVALDSTINTKASEWHISVTDDNIMYFTSEREEGTSALHGDLYRAEIKNEQFIRLTKLPHPINTEYNDSDPLIAPDESFLVFHSDRPGGFGEHDLYISFNLKGQWSSPINLGNQINTDSWEMAPALTPDGKYFLFTRRKALVTDEPSRIYWVSSSIFRQYENTLR